MGPSTEPKEIQKIPISQNKEPLGEQIRLVLEAVTHTKHLWRPFGFNEKKVGFGRISKPHGKSTDFHSYLKFSNSIDIH